MILDTCFLIDLQREFHSRTAGAARLFVEAHLETHFQISTVSVVEFLEGFEDQSRGERLIANLEWIDVDEEVARIAASIRRNLRKNRSLIGDFDILIAATALASDLPLVTNDREHFERVDELEVIDYPAARANSSSGSATL